MRIVTSSPCSASYTTPYGSVSRSIPCSGGAALATRSGSISAGFALNRRIPEKVPSPGARGTRTTFFRTGATRPNGSVGASSGASARPYSARSPRHQSSGAMRCRRPRRRPSGLLSCQLGGSWICSTIFCGGIWRPGGRPGRPRGGASPAAAIARSVSDLRGRPRPRFLGGSGMRTGATGGAYRSEAGSDIVSSAYGSMSGSSGASGAGSTLDARLSATLDARLPNASRLGGRDTLCGVTDDRSMRVSSHIEVPYTESRRGVSESRVKRLTSRGSGTSVSTDTERPRGVSVRLEERVASRSHETSSGGGSVLRRVRECRGVGVSPASSVRLNGRTADTSTLDSHIESLARDVDACVASASPSEWVASAEMRETRRPHSSWTASGVRSVRPVRASTALPPPLSSPTSSSSSDCSIQSRTRLDSAKNASRSSFPSASRSTAPMRRPVREPTPSSWKRRAGIAALILAGRKPRACVVVARGPSGGCVPRCAPRGWRARQRCGTRRSAARRNRARASEVRGCG